MMIHDPQTRAKPTLEDLLRVKRAERPDSAFWQEFERGMRQKQLAAIIEPRPWWMPLALLRRKVGPLGLPLSAGAAALLAMVVMRVSPVGGLSHNGSTSSPEPVTIALAPGAAPESDATPTASPNPPSPANQASAPTAESTSLSPSANTSGPSSYVDLATAQSSASSAPAPNNAGPAAASSSLDPAQGTVSPISALENGPAILSSANLTTFAEPGSSDVSTLSLAVLNDELQPENVVLDPRQARLLTSASEVDEGRTVVNLRERTIHRLANDESRYDAISRLGVNADRLSLKF